MLCSVNSPLIFAGTPETKETGRNIHIFQDHTASGNDTEITNSRFDKNRSTVTDQRTASDLAFYNAIMTDHSVIANCDKSVKYSVFLDVTIAADTYRRSIRSENNARPDACVLFDFHIANQIGCVSHECRIGHLGVFPP